MTFNSNALTNLYMLAENLGGSGIKDAHKLVAANSGSYIQHINSASEWIENQIGFPLFSGSLQNEKRSGNNSMVIYTDRGIAGMDDITVYRVRYYTGPELTDYYDIDTENWKWAYNAETGRIYTVDGNIFFKDSAIDENWEIQYSYGLPLTSIPTDGEIKSTSVPADLQWAVAMIVKRKENLPTQMGVVSGTSTDGRNVSYNPDFIPSEVYDIINKYRRYTD